MAVAALRLDGSTPDLFSPVGLCASLRRSASFHCPTTPRQLVDAVMSALAPLDVSSLLTRDQVADQLNLLIALGDLIELRLGADRGTRELYLGPPSFVEKTRGFYLLTGIRPSGAPLVDDSLVDGLEYEAHTRSIKLAAQAAVKKLKAAGLHEVRREHWLGHPPRESVGHMVAQMRHRLDDVGPSGEIDGLTIIDPTSSVRYYRGRRRPHTAKDSGDFIGRRPQAYGADLWCLVRLDAGAPQRLVDLPVDNEQAAGYDEAWRYQAAVDAEREQPQELGVRAAAGSDDSRVLDVFAPVPSWAQRYLEMFGKPVSGSSGALVSYRVPSAAVGELSTFFTEMLWMRVTEDGGTA